MSLDEEGNPSLEANRGKARDVWFLIVSFLDKVVLAPKISVYPRY